MMLCAVPPRPANWCRGRQHSSPARSVCRLRFRRCSSAAAPLRRHSHDVPSEVLKDLAVHGALPGLRVVPRGGRSLTLKICSRTLHSHAYEEPLTERSRIAHPSEREPSGPRQIGAGPAFARITPRRCASVVVHPAQIPLEIGTGRVNERNACPASDNFYGARLAHRLPAVASHSAGHAATRIAFVTPRRCERAALAARFGPGPGRRPLV
jgi:hypothetical protein